MQSQRQIKCPLFALTTVSFANENILIFVRFVLLNLRGSRTTFALFSTIFQLDLSASLGEMMLRTEKTDLLLAVRGEKSILQFVRLIEQKSERENAVSTL